MKELQPQSSPEITPKPDWTVLPDSDIEELVDKGLRHRSGATPVDYLYHWLAIGRQFAFATQDDSWGEFEKLFSIMVRRMVSAERALKRLASPEAFVVARAIDPERDAELLARMEYAGNVTGPAQR